MYPTSSLHTELGGLARPALGAAADLGEGVVTARWLQEKLLSGYADKKHFAGTLSARVSAPKAMIARSYATLSSAFFVFFFADIQC